MSLFNNIQIDGVLYLEPNSFNVTDDLQYETLTNIYGDDIIIERKGNNYKKASISISWNAVSLNYANNLKNELATHNLHTIQRSGDTWTNLKLVSFQKELIDDFREQAKKGNIYCDLSVEFTQITSEALGNINN